MAKLNINLLPPEIEAAKKQKNHLSSALKFSIFFLVGVIGIAVVVLSIRLSQNILLSNINKDLTRAKTTLNSDDYKNREGLAITLKDRLENVETLLGQNTYASYAYNLFSSLVPTDLQISSFNIDNKGTAKLTVATNSISSLETFLNQLVTPESNQQKVQTVRLDGISQSKTSAYDTELSILMVGATAVTAN